MGVGEGQGDSEQRIACVERGDRAKETREGCKKGDKKKWENDRGEAGIRYLNEYMRDVKREREGGREGEKGSELIMGLCCRDKAEQHLG